MKWSFWVFISIICSIGVGSAAAGQKETQRLETAIDVLGDIANIPEKTIPHYLFEKASGIAIIPGVIKGAFVFGARWGKGIIVVRTPEGGWSDPSFISLAGGSIGWQIGGESIDFVLIFRTARSVEGITNGKFTLGVDASVAAGPVGRNAEAGTDVQMKAEIYSYARGRGLFAGASIEGSSLQIDEDANEDFYKVRDVGARSVFAGRVTSASPLVAQLRRHLANLSHATSLHK